MHKINLIHLFLLFSVLLRWKMNKTQCANRIKQVREQELATQIKYIKLVSKAISSSIFAMNPKTGFKFVHLDSFCLFEMHTEIAEENER